MGRSREASLRWTTTRAQVSGSLYSSRRHLQSRLRALENGHVSFDWKDYADHSRTKTMTLDAVEFIRRFLLHVLPSGMVRIRADEFPIRPIEFIFRIGDPVRMYSAFRS